jgi:hypothetical protein
VQDFPGKKQSERECQEVKPDQLFSSIDMRGLIPDMNFCVLSQKFVDLDRQ